MQIPLTDLHISTDDALLLERIVEPGEYVIGREPECDLVVEAELVSRRHARLTVNYSEILIEDLGSANGTFVAGKPVTGAVRLWPGQVVRIGAATLRARRLRPADDGQSIMPWTAELRKQLPEELRREGRYAIQELVAQGGMGAILSARDQTIRRTVAMKVMLDARSGEETVRFLEEAQVTGQLEHPNIVPIYELGVDECEQPFYTMKFVRGITLKKVLELIAEGEAEIVKKYPLAALLTVFQKVCDAIAFAHSRGIIHRDLKPENVMIGDFGEVLVMDWGLAKAQAGTGAEPAPVAGPQGGTTSSMIRSVRIDSGEFGATMAGTILGTPSFMAPEQAEGRVEALDARTDVFALGGILYSILTLRLPFTGDTVEEILEKVVSGKIEPPASLRSTARGAAADSPGQLTGTRHLPGGRVPESLSAVAMKALATRPDARYQTVPELQRDLEAYQGGFATRAERAGAAKLLLLLIRRHKATAISASLILLVGLVMGGRALFEGKRAERALAQLRKTEPALLSQAEASISLQRFPEALERLDFAATVSPRSPEVLRRRANLLQAMLRLEEAVPAYESLLAVRPDEPARKNLELCQTLLAEHQDPDHLSTPALNALYEAMVGQQRLLEAVPLGERLGRAKLQSLALVRERLKVWSNLPDWERFERVVQSPSGAIGLYLTDLPIHDLSPLQGLSLEAVFLHGSKVTDLSPLRGMSLHRFGASRSPLVDLEPLRGMPIAELTLSESQVTNLDLLATLPLTRVDLYKLPIRDLSPLRGKALAYLRIANTPVDSLDALRGMPLRELEANSCPISDFSPLLDLPLEALMLSGTSIANIDLLRGMPLRHVNLASTKVADFSALTGKKLVFFGASDNGAVSNIDFLRGMPLQWVSLGRCAHLTDVSVLAECPTLKMATVPRGARGIELLRKLPNLEKIGYVPKAEIPAAQFWAEYDAKAKTGPSP